MGKLLKIFFVLFLFSGTLLLAKSLENAAEPLELVHADQSDLRMEKDNVILNLNGNIQFKHGEAELYSDRAVWYQSSGLVIFIGRVKIIEPEQLLTAERVTYYQKFKKVVADEDVKAESKKENTVIQGGHGEYDRVRKHVIFTRNPSLIYNPQFEDSALTVSADTLEYLVELKRGTARSNVRIIKGKTEATCDNAELYEKEERIVLSGKPVARRENSELSGEIIEIRYSENKIFKIEVTGDARATHRELADSLNQSYNQSHLAGKILYFVLDEGEKLKQVKVLGNATSLYYPSSKDTLAQTRNEASGDSLELNFGEDKLKSIIVMGGAIGSYYYPAEAKDSLHSEDTVSYSAWKIDYQVEREQIALEDNCILNYRQITLKSGKVIYDTEKEYLKAEGIYKEEEGENKLSQLPVLMDGAEELKGEEMSYFLNTRKGKVKAGRTEFQSGYYYGSQLGKIDEDVFLTSGGTYTTCDQNTPHFHFYSTKMKIITRDKVIARPVVMYLQDIPVAAIPFYVFPIKPGRHSGFLAFEVGNFVSGERFIRNLGYYWAASDYWDLESSMDYYEGSGWLLRENFRYARRYNYSGSISGSFKQDVQESFVRKTKTNRWDLILSHSHNLSPVTKLSGSGRFISDNSYYRDYSFDAQERRNRIIHSQASLSTKYSEAGIYIALDQLENLDENSKTLKLPTFRISKSYFYPFKSAADLAKRWYQSLYLSFSSSFQNYYSKTKLSEGFTRKKFSTLDNSMSLSFPQKIFGYIVLSPSFNYRGSFYYVFETDQSKEREIKVNSLAHRSSYSLGLNA
ncbi:MAG: putative LPS assembly protein LptD, partial [candidate division Zixibacteria bacterium]|nr:putative LPS assembly protein LptD [candidate division Zixibacteria bacterium]